MRAYERLIKYASFDTAADRNSDTCPSTAKQLILGRYLVEEMKSLGIQDANMDENGYVFGTIPANVECQAPVIGFIAHMDTVDEVPTTNVQTKITYNYQGGDIVLNERENIVIRVAETDNIERHIGKDILTTDGMSLLGADDKAGVAEIMCMAETLMQHPEIEHGTIRIAFTPDEEIGRSAQRFDVKRFGADFAYTLDGGEFGEITYETFSSAGATITIHGRSFHPGWAKDKLLSAAQVAIELQNLLPAAQRPEHTEGYEGYFHMRDISGNVETATLHYGIADFDMTKLEQKKQLLLDAVDFLNKKYGAGTVEIDMQDRLRNMAEKVWPHMHLIEIASEAIREAGGEPQSPPLRGGTDGSQLSFKGLPCPNLGKAARNSHSRREYAIIQDMDRIVDCLVKIAEKYTHVKL